MTGAIILDGVAVEVPGFDVQQSPMPIGLSEARKQPVKRLVLHHDAALSAKSCKAILEKRKLSTHFCVDNDGTIVQFFDPAKRVSWHAGIYNSTGVGIDVSNAVELKWASRYTPRRAEVEQRIHGIKIRGLASYALQQRALEALCCVLCRELGTAQGAAVGRRGASPGSARPGSFGDRRSPALDQDEVGSLRRRLDCAPGHGRAGDG